MAQDFAKRSKSRKKQPPPARFSLGSFMAGVVVGVGLFLLGAYGPELLDMEDIQEDLQRSVRTAQDRPAAEADANAAPIAEAESNDPSKAERQNLEFEFRDLLGADRVEPDTSAYETNLPSQQAKAGVHYLLQSGSFQIRADAESRRGSLLLLNLPANIVEAELENRIWYRVIVGPYTGRSEAQQVAVRLRAEQIDPILLERPLTKG